MSDNKRPTPQDAGRAESTAVNDRAGTEPTVPVSRDDQMRAAVHGNETGRKPGLADVGGKPAAEGGTQNQQRPVDRQGDDAARDAHDEPTVIAPSTADRERIGAQDTQPTPRVTQGAGRTDGGSAAHTGAPDEREVEQTRPLDVDQLQAEERDRDAEREARQRALGVRSRSEEEATPLVAPRQIRTTDRWHGSLAFLVLRWLVAGIIGIRSYQHFTHLTAAQEYYSNSRLPHFAYYGWAVAVLEALIAVFLFLGLATRVAGFLLLALEVVTLVFFVWGKVNPFMDGRMGFNGEFELLLAGLGIVFVLLGSGGWATDAGFRRRRRKAKEAKAMGNPV